MNYYESWKQGGKADEYYLDRAYMHIHLAAGSLPQQIFSLHCDPSLHPSSGHFQYKRGPHVHVEGAKPNVSHAHISLCLMDQNLGGADLPTLTLSFGQAVKMIADELLPCWERT
ncbi:MAG TPA: hypothetical protein VK804_28370 [Bradyrhizobium sp.]|uniref:hypothetical protein n=1 Tax=Bradyrhizobium sp. TaxID=376 RepID=UPI002C7386A3|nr:hypothetical protein [Bradyrhizobium sp.]HTB04400.1 hypothetical protein [Bradyrhizobium sp.]